MSGINIKEHVRDYRADTRGNFNIMLAFLVTPLLIAAGMSVDISRQVKADVLVQDALDSAALYAATLDYETQEELETESKRMFEENLKGQVELTVSDFTAVPDESGNILLDAKGTLNPMFMQIGGTPKLGVSAKSGAIAKSDKGLEIVIAIDSTASMAFGNSWQQAMATMDSVLTKIEKYTGHDGFYVTLVPFTDRVRLGENHSDWLGESTPSNWNGCFEPREVSEPGYPWALSDSDPDAAPFYASIPGVRGGLIDSEWGDEKPDCPNVPITGPTSNVSNIVTAANRLEQSGTGRFDVGLAWSWRLLSSKWSGYWNAADTSYPSTGEDGRRKVAILITDGLSEAYTYELSQEQEWTHNEGSTEAFNHLTHLCDKMKADDIEMYMFRITGNDRIAPYMQNCATSSDHYQVVQSNADLQLAFLDILESFEKELHLTR